LKFVGDTLSSTAVSDDGATHAITLPHYHRAAVGLFNGTRLFVVPLRSTNELVLTPIDPKAWGDLWSLEATVKDEPGAAKSLVETFVKHKVNVLVHEGVSESAEKDTIVHRVFEILDLAKYTSDADLSSGERGSVGKVTSKPNYLVTNLIAHSADKLHQTHELDDWELRFKRMEFFFRNKDIRVNAVELGLNVDKQVLVPVGLLRQLEFAGDAKRPLALHIISDTEQKYLKLRVLNPKRYFLLLAIEHAEQVGAIDAFMGVFRARKVNMVDSYSRLQRIDETAWFYTLAELPGRMSPGRVARLLTELAESQLAHAVIVKGATGLGPTLKMLTELPDKALPDNVSIRESPESRSRETGQGGQVHREISSGKATAPSHLGVPYFHARNESEKWRLNTAQVFMAIPFSEAYGEFYKDFVAGPVEEVGLEPIRIDEMPLEARRRPIVEHIEEAIARSRFVIADVSGWNPNVVYELGLAMGISKPILVLYDSQQFEQRIAFDFQAYPLIIYSPYKAASLREVLTARVRELKEATEPRERGPQVDDPEKG
jgi:hypothetical protein